MAGTLQFKYMFGFKTNHYWCSKNRGEPNCYRDKRAMFDSYKRKWDVVSIMGTHHIQTPKGVVFNAPYARVEKFMFEVYKKRIVGTIVLKEDNKAAEVAEGNWYDSFRFNKREYLRDPHNMDQTGSAFAQGNFYHNKDLFNFVVGAPNADNLRGITYICRDCFGTSKSSKKYRRTLQAPNPQIGERYGAAVAAVDIDGDGLDDVVVGAQLHSRKVIKIPDT